MMSLISITAGALIVFCIAVTIVIIAGLRAVIYRNKKKSDDENDDMIVQELYRDLEKMQKRIEALETLLNEKKKD